MGVGILHHLGSQFPPLRVLIPKSQPWLASLRWTSARTIDTCQKKRFFNITNRLSFMHAASKGNAFCLCTKQSQDDQTEVWYSFHIPFSLLAFHLHTDPHLQVQVFQCVSENPILAATTKTSEGRVYSLPSNKSWILMIDGELNFRMVVP